MHYVPIRAPQAQARDGGGMNIFSGASNDPQRIRVAAEQNRLDGFAAIEQAQRQLELTVQQQRAGNQLARDQRRFDAELRAEKRQARAEQTAHLREVGQTIGRRGLITGPILAPMVVAWVGQIGFATDTLNWPLAGALVFAASWELTTAFAGWMFHQARSAGDGGTTFRAATWLFASAAGAMNYWHALDGAAINHPTPKAVSYGAMSLVGIALWELYSSLVHRQGLRARGALPPARPKFGMARWLRYTRLTFRAWSLSIHDGLSTTDAAWHAALARQAEKATGHAITMPSQVENADPGTPADHASDGSPQVDEARHATVERQEESQRHASPADRAEQENATPPVDGTPAEKASSESHATEKATTEPAQVSHAKKADKAKDATKPGRGSRPADEDIEKARQILQEWHANGVELNDRRLSQETGGAIGRTAAARIIREAREARQAEKANRANQATDQREERTA